jgi:hypothetical protein
MGLAYTRFCLIRGHHPKVGELKPPLRKWVKWTLPVGRAWRVPSSWPGRRGQVTASTNPWPVS